MSGNLFFFILLALLAEILGTIGGFGSSVFFVPIASLYLDFQSVLGITALFHVLSNLSKITLFRKGVDKKLVIWLGIPAVVFVVLGAWSSRFFPTDTLQVLLAIFLIGISLFFLLGKLTVKPRPIYAGAGGVLSGFIAGLLGTGGAIRGLVLSAYRLRPEVFIATSALIDLAIDSSRALVYWRNGYIHQHDLYLIPILAVVSFVGTLIGKLILKRFSEDQFRTIVLLMILGTGVFTLLRSL